MIRAGVVMPQIRGGCSLISGLLSDLPCLSIPEDPVDKDMLCLCFVLLLALEKAGLYIRRALLFQGASVTAAILGVPGVEIVLGLTCEA